MPEVDPKLADWTTRELRARGIEVRTGTLLQSVENDCAKLSTGETIAHPDRLLDRRRQAARGGARARPAAPAERPARRRPRRCGCAAARTSGRWATRAAVPDAAANYERPCAAHRPARAAPGQARRRQRRRAARPRQGPAVHLQDARRVRRPGPQPGRGEHGRAQAERLPGLVGGAHLPPGDDAGHRAQGAADGRLDRRPGVRARLVGARPARPPAVAARLPRVAGHRGAAPTSRPAAGQAPRRDRRRPRLSATAGRAISPTTFALAQRAMHDAAQRQGFAPRGPRAVGRPTSAPTGCASARSSSGSPRSRRLLRARRVGRGRARRLRAHRADRRDGAADRADGRARAAGRRPGPRSCSSAAGRGADAGARAHRRGHRGAQRPDALHELRRHAGRRPLAPAPAHRALPRGALAGGRDRGPGCTC